MLNQIIRNEDAQGSFDLKKASRATGPVSSPVIPGGAVVTIRLAGDVSTQVLSTASSEVTVDDASEGLISYVIAPAKSVLLKEGLGLPVDIIVTAAGIAHVYEFTNGVDVKDLAQ